MTPEPRVSRTAYLLGFAGLLPQVGAVLLLLRDGPARRSFSAAGGLLALGYGAAILSFLGGIWWGFALKRRSGQSGLAMVSVLPSLAAAAVGCWAGILSMASQGGGNWMRTPLLALGVAILFTLLVDRRLAATGEAPAGWMRLRVPLSLGLGGLTILAGLLAA